MLYVHVTQRLSHTGMPQAIGFSNMTNMVCFQARLTKTISLMSAFGGSLVWQNGH
jgi:hypothetical protein